MREWTKPWLGDEAMVVGAVGGLKDTVCSTAAAAASSVSVSVTGQAWAGDRECTTHGTVHGEYRNHPEIPAS